MKLGKKKRQPVVSLAKQRPDGPAQGHSIAFFSGVSFLAMMVILLIWGGSLFVVQASRTDQQGVARVHIGAEGLAARLHDMVDFYAGIMMRIAKDQSIARSFIEEDTPALHRQEKRLKNLLPGAARVLLLPVGFGEIGSPPDSKLSFASLEMLRTAEKSERVTDFEVHPVSGGQRIIAVATKVVYPGQLEPAGIIFAAFPADMLQRRVDDVSDYAGRVEVQQIDAGGQPLVLAVNAGAPVAEGVPDGAFPIPGSIWQVAYWRLVGTHEDWSNLLLLGAMLAVILVLMGAVLVIQTRRVQQALRQDLASIVSVVDEMVNGSPIRTRAARLKEVWHTLELVSRRGRSLHAGTTRGARKAGAEEALPEPAAEFAEAGPGPDAGAASSLLPPQIVVNEVPAKPVPMPIEIFRANDIRGVVGASLTSEVVYDIGRAIGSEAYGQGQQTVIVGRDGRNSATEICDALCQGLQESGRDVIDLGVVPTPVVYFATHYLGSSSGVMVTGGHNPPEYSGLKVVLGGDTLCGDDIQGLRRRLEAGDLLQGEGTRQEQDLIPDYIGRILDDVRLASGMKVVVDCGNGSASTVALDLFRALGCEVIELFCELDGDFPNHQPDPGVPENLHPLILEVQAQRADIGLAFDGDGDRLGVVDGDGNIIWPDRLLMLLASDVLSRRPGADILYDVKCSRHLAGEILAYGGRPLMWKTGHAILKAKLKETGALLGGDFSGHIIFKERWFGFDDALYAAARLLEILAADPRTSTEVFDELPQSVMTPELKVHVAEGQASAIMQEILSLPELAGAKMTTLDGLRAEFEVGWGLVRASQTSPSLTFRFEADNEAGLAQIQKVFRSMMSRTAPDLQLPF